MILANGNNNKSKKKLTNREARAKLKIIFSEKSFEKIISGNSHKGEIYNLARSAGISAAKKTSELIPLCHNLPISYIDIDFKIDKKSLTIEILSKVKTQFSRIWISFWVVFESPN